MQKSDRKKETNRFCHASDDVETMYEGKGGGGFYKM
jgi:hypothetical protein